MVEFGNVNHPAAEVLQTIIGEINKKSSDPSDVIPEAVSYKLFCVLHMSPFLPN